MKNIKHIASATVLALAISSSAFAGEITGGRTAKSGEITGGRTAQVGEITGGRTALSGEITGGLVDLVLTMFSIIG